MVGERAGEPGWRWSEAAPLLRPAAGRFTSRSPDRPDVASRNGLELITVLLPRESIMHLACAVGVGRHHSQRRDLARFESGRGQEGMLQPLQLTEEIVELDRDLSRLHPSRRCVLHQGVYDQKYAGAVDTILNDSQARLGQGPA